MKSLWIPISTKGPRFLVGRSVKVRHRWIKVAGCTGDVLSGTLEDSREWVRFSIDEVEQVLE